MSSLVIQPTPLSLTPSQPTEVPDMEEKYLAKTVAEEEFSRRISRFRHSRGDLTAALASAQETLRSYVDSDGAAREGINDIRRDIDQPDREFRGAANALEELLEAQDDQPTLPITEQELFNKVKEMLGRLDSGYLAYYQEAITKFTEYFDEIRSALNKITSGHSSSANYPVAFTPHGVHEALEDILAKRWTIASFDKEEDAKKLVESLAPAFVLVRDGDRWTVRINTLQAQELWNQLDKIAPLEGRPPNQTRPAVNISNASFNTWTNKRDSSFASLNTASQGTAEAFSRANSTYDNLVKLLSSLIESMMKMMEGFLPT